MAWRSVVVDAEETAVESVADASQALGTHGTERPTRDRRGQDRPRLRAPRPRRYDRHGLTQLKRIVATREQLSRHGRGWRKPWS